MLIDGAALLIFRDARERSNDLDPNKNGQKSIAASVWVAQMARNA